MSQEKYKISVIATHIIQYGVPLYQKITSHPDIDLTVYFCSDEGLGLRRDDKFGIKIKWDNINLEGLNYKFLKNYSPLPSVNYFFGLINPGIIRELKENRYDAIIIGGYYTFSFWLAFLAARLTNTKVILTGEPPSPWKSRLRKFIMQQVKRIFLPGLIDFASAILYIGKRSREYYMVYKDYTKDLEKKLFFTPYAVDNDFLFNLAQEYSGKENEIKSELGLPAGYPVILFLSKLIKWKRPLLLLELLPKLKTPAILIYVGSGPRIETLKNYVSQNKIENVYFFGFQNYSQIAKFYAIADIFVLPSLGESWGLVVNEAMCFGLPVVITDKVSSGDDLVRQGENGFVFPSQNKQRLLEILEYLLQDPKVRVEMGNKSKEIISRWNYDCYIRGLSEALNHIYKK